MADSESPTPHRDAGYALLADQRRRCLLGLVSDRRTKTVEELVTSIAEREGLGSPPDEESRQQIRISLVHNHLPRLEDHDAVEYDRERHTVTTGRRFEEIRPLVELADPTGEGVYRPSEPYGPPGVESSEQRANCDE